MTTPQKEGKKKTKNFYTRVTEKREGGERENFSNHIK